MSEGQYVDERYDVLEIEEEVEPGVEQVGPIRLELVTVWEKGATHRRWVCVHGESALTPEDAAANCVAYCEGGTT